MASTADYLMLQYLMSFAVSVIFSGIAIDRQTLLSTLIAAFAWLVTAILSFVYAPTVIGSLMGWVFGLLAFVFCGAFLWSLISNTLDAQHKRFDPRGPL